MEGNFSGLSNNLNCTYYGTHKILQQGLKENAYSITNRCFQNQLKVD